MDTFTVQWLPNHNIIQGKTLASFDMRRDIHQAACMLSAVLDQAAGPVPYILDLTEVKMDFGEMIYAMADLTRGEDAVWRHPNLKEIVVITGSSMIRLGANSLRQVQYGGIKTAAFATLQEAYDYLGYRQSLAQAA